MVLIKMFFYIFLLFFSYSVQATSLIDQLSMFFQQEYSLEKKNTKVIIHTVLKKNMSCKKPLFFIYNHSRSFGLMDVLLTCDQFKQYLQIDLQVTGKYIISNKFIPRGSQIKESDIKIMIGRLDTLPNRTYLNEKDVINTVIMRDIFPFQPITSLMTHPLWLVKMNQQVTVFINEVDFIVTAIGKALNNACRNQLVRVKMNTNNIITGIVTDKGEVRVNI